MDDMSGDELTEFAEYLVDINELTTPSEVVDFFKNPHGWHSEFLAWQNGKLKAAAEAV